MLTYETQPLVSKHTQAEQTWCHLCCHYRNHNFLTCQSLLRVASSLKSSLLVPKELQTELLSFSVYHFMQVWVFIREITFCQIMNCYCSLKSHLRSLPWHSERYKQIWMTPCPGWEVARFGEATKRLHSLAPSETSDLDWQALDPILSLLLIWTDQLWVTTLMISTPQQQMEWRLPSPTWSKMSQLLSTCFVYLSSCHPVTLFLLLHWT